MDHTYAPQYPRHWCISQQQSAQGGIDGNGLQIHRTRPRLDARRLLPDHPRSDNPRLRHDGSRRGVRREPACGAGRQAGQRHRNGYLHWPDRGAVGRAAVAHGRERLRERHTRPRRRRARRSVTGSATFTGLSVDLWDGQQWWAVANGSGTATFALEDGTAAATLVPASELPAGDYTQIRLTATNAVVDLTLDDGSRQFSAGLQSNGPVVITKSVTVTVNPDGSRTLAVQFEMVRSVALDVDPTSGAASVSVTGDFGAATAAASAR